MLIGAGDLKFLLSGGLTNTDPNASLGGAPSVNPIAGTTLFQDVSTSEATAGSTKYRCIYLSNDNLTETLYNASIFVQYDVPSGADVNLGYLLQNDRQFITVTNASTITGGNNVFSYSDTSVHGGLVANWSVSVLDWALNIQSALRTVPNLEDITVSGSYDSISDSTTFEINFIGLAGYRFHEILVETNNNLTYSGYSQPVLNIDKAVSGSPINSEADSIDTEITPPTNVVFSTSAFQVGQIRNLDVIPVWIKRVVPPNAAATQDDGFTMRVSGTALP